jgi:hypothetical protein
VITNTLVRRPVAVTVTARSFPLPSIVSYDTIQY